MAAVSSTDGCPVGGATTGQWQSYNHVQKSCKAIRRPRARTATCRFLLHTEVFCCCVIVFSVDFLLRSMATGGYRRWICHWRGCERRRRSCERERVQLQTRARGSGWRCLAFAQGRRERPILVDLTRERNCSETRNNVSRGSDG